MYMYMMYNTCVSLSSLSVSLCLSPFPSLTLLLAFPSPSLPPPSLLLQPMCIHSFDLNSDGVTQLATGWSNGKINV